MESLRHRAQRGERLIGALLRMPAEEQVEMLAIAGMDFVVLDCEHGPDDIIALRQHIALAALHQMSVIVRVGLNGADQCLRVLDQGADGILAPHVDSREDAQALVAATMYPPLGNRGFATYSRAGRFGQTAPAAHLKALLENTLVLGMIESPLGVANAAEIIATPRLDGIMIGPADLAAASGPTDLPLAEAMACVNADLAQSGSLRMDIVGTSSEAMAAFESGANLVVYNLAQSVMAHFTQLVTPAH